jgi:hypothetical protein
MRDAKVAKFEKDKQARELTAPDRKESEDAGEEE